MMQRRKKAKIAKAIKYTVVFLGGKCIPFECPIGSNMLSNLIREGNVVSYTREGVVY